MPYDGFSSRKVRSRGPDDAKVLIVGEAPGEHEDRELRAFVGSSGAELDRQLAEARFVASACRFTNAIRFRPQGNEIDLAFCSSKKRAEECGATTLAGRYALPVAVDGWNELRDEIAAISPSVIIAVGGTALWATTGKEGIDAWRGSEIPCIHDGNITVVPTYHPAGILRSWENRHLAIHDLKRANRVLQFGRTPAPTWNFRVRPSFETVMECLDLAESTQEIAVDIETKRLHIVCVGIAWDRYNAVCIPFVDRFGAPYWGEHEELIIIERLQKLLSTHRVIGQNFHYDAQYFSRRQLVIPSCSFDTLLAQHVLFPGTPKDLAHLSSLYCPYHVYWKDDGKEWDPRIHTEEQLWTYNCVDCVKTFEVKESQQVLITKYSLQSQFDFLMRLWPQVLSTMLRGVRVDVSAKAASVIELGAAIAQRDQWLNTVIGYEFSTSSSAPAMKHFFAEEMGVKLKKGKKTKGVSLDKKALKIIADEHILLWPIVQTIEERRSLQVFKSTFAEADLDMDGRMRCSYNMGGTETFRFSSSENAFYTGTNLQNIPKGDRSTTMVMPNMRKLFTPDEGMEIAEVDLAGADAQVVAWEANDDILKGVFRRKEKLHAFNAKDLFGAKAGPDGKAEPWYTMAKQGVHATNYLCTPPTLAKTLGITVHEADRFQKRWFDIHPGIKDWHRRIEADLHRDRSVRNRFGFRRVYFERIESIQAEAVAWVPQSTVAIVINWAFIKIGEARSLPVEILFQVHDSLVFQYPAEKREEVLRAVHPLLLTPVPYQDPLIIQLGLKTSTKSWGDCEDREWPIAA